MKTAAARVVMILSFVAAVAGSDNEDPGESVHNRVPIPGYSCMAESESLPYHNCVTQLEQAKIQQDCDTIEQNRKAICSMALAPSKLCKDAIDYHDLKCKDGKPTGFHWQEGMDVSKAKTSQVVLLQDSTFDTDTCIDKQPPSGWNKNTCEKQKAAGNCEKPWFRDHVEGYCKKTCGQNCTAGAVAAADTGPYITDELNQDLSADVVAADDSATGDELECIPTRTEFIDMPDGTQSIRFKNCSGCTFSTISDTEFLEEGGHHWQLKGKRQDQQLVRSVDGCVACPHNQVYTEFWNQNLSAEVSPGFCEEIGKSDSGLWAFGAQKPVVKSKLYVSKAGTRTLGLWYGGGKGPDTWTYFQKWYPFWSIICSYVKIVGCNADRRGVTQCATYKKVMPFYVGVPKVNADNTRLANDLGLHEEWYNVDEAPWATMALNETRVRTDGCARLAAIL